MSRRSIVPLLAILIAGTALLLWFGVIATSARLGWSAQVLRRVRAPGSERLVDIHVGADDFAGWLGVTEGGDVLLGAPESRVGSPTAGDRFRRVTSFGLAITEYGRLFQVGRHPPARDLHLSAPPGALLALGDAGTWIAGADGSLVVLLGTLLKTHWGSGSPVTALSSGRGYVLVGRTSGAVELGDSNDPGVRRLVLSLEAPVSAVEIGADGRVAAADVHGHVRVDKPLPGEPTEWNAGGSVVALAFQWEGPDAGPIALRDDGVLMAPPRDGHEARALCRLGAHVQAAEPRAGRCCAKLLVATDKGVYEVEAVYRGEAGR